jgi:hypothetical protein
MGRGIVSAFAAASAAIDIRDVLLFGGNGLLGYGLYTIYPPAAFIASGSIFVAVAVFGTR